MFREETHCSHCLVGCSLRQVLKSSDQLKQIHLCSDSDHHLSSFLISMLGFHIDPDLTRFRVLDVSALATAAPSAEKKPPVTIDLNAESRLGQILNVVFI